MANTSDIMGARDRDAADEVCEGAGRHLDRLSGRRDGLPISCLPPASGPTSRSCGSTRSGRIRACLLRHVGMGRKDDHWAALRVVESQVNNLVERQLLGGDCLLPLFTTMVKDFSTVPAPVLMSLSFRPLLR
jgi:hypothetical protein